MSIKGLQTDGQSERTFRTLENMFRACVRNWVVVGILTFHEMSFSTKIVIIRARRGRSPALQTEIGESKTIGIETEQEMTKVVVIKERLKEAKDRQES
nr:reverse transcriptase domain-containing protein [Tanacetum cinerariifolium]